MKRPDKRSGTQLSKRKWQSKKRVSIWVFAVLISICGSLVYGYMKVNKREIHPYLYTKWGMSLEECEEIVDLLNAKSKIVLRQEQEVICTITDYQGRKDIDGLVSFMCKENGLEEIEVYIINRRGNAYSRQVFIHDHVKWLDTLCGKHNKDSVVYTWLKDRTQIELIDYPDKPVCIRYKWINKE